jgi:hypothetical protein
VRHRVSRKLAGGCDDFGLIDEAETDFYGTLPNRLSDENDMFRTGEKNRFN